MLRQLVFATALLAACTAPALAETLQLRVDTAEVVADPMTGQDTLQIQFVSEAEDVLAQFTAKNVGRAVDMSVDGVLLSSPILQSPIMGGTVVLSGGLTDLDLHFMALRLNAKKALVEITQAE